MADPIIAVQLDAFIDKYSAEMAIMLRDCRARMHDRWPHGYELVYDNYNALVFGYGPTDRPSDAVMSLAAYPRYVRLFFLQGSGLSDSRGLLQGSGKQARSIRLTAAADLNTEPVVELMEQAMHRVVAALANAPARVTLIKSVSAKQRPRR